MSKNHLSAVRELTIQSLFVFAALTLSTTSGLAQTVEGQENHETSFINRTSELHLDVVPLKPALSFELGPSPVYSFTKVKTIPEKSSIVGLAIIGSLGVVTLLKPKKKLVS